MSTSQPDLEEYFARHPSAMAHTVLAHRGRPFDKWLHYFEIYDRHFGRFRGKPVNFLEIGVNRGGSLQLWRGFLGPQATIHGIDANPAAREMEAEGFQIHIGDQADPAFLARLKADVPRLDVVVDDGGHHMHQLLASFESLYPHLASEGVYLCEDLHTCYMQSYGGGFRHPNSFLEKSKAWVDLLNAYYSEDEALRATDFARTTWSLHYYDSVLVVEKRPWHHPVLLVADGGTLVPHFARPSHRRTGFP
jgi:hypothetical protein